MKADGATVLGLMMVGVLVGVVMGMLFVMLIVPPPGRAAQVACQQQGFFSGEYSEETGWKVMCDQRRELK